jgi:hypothetical protein
VRRATEKAAKKAKQRQAREDRKVAWQLRQETKAAKRTPRKKNNKAFNEEVQLIKAVEVEEAAPPPLGYANKENTPTTEV